MKRLPKGLWYTKYFDFNFTIGVRCAIRVQLQVNLKALKSGCTILDLAGPRSTGRPRTLYLSVVTRG